MIQVQALFRTKVILAGSIQTISYESPKTRPVEGQTVRQLFHRETIRRDYLRYPPRPIMCSTATR